jgi:hypothetical protein
MLDKNLDLSGFDLPDLRDRFFNDVGDQMETAPIGGQTEFVLEKYHNKLKR